MRLNNILLAALACCILYLAFMLKIKQREIDALNTQNQTLAADIKRQIVIERRHIIYKNNTCAKTETKTYFIPVEGRAVLTQNLKDELSVKITDKGFTFKPFIGLALAQDGAFEPFAGARVLYYKRYGLGGAITYGGPVIAADRRLDDILPFENTALTLLGGYKKIYIGFAVYL